MNTITLINYITILQLNKVYNYYYKVAPKNASEKIKVKLNGKL